MLKGKKLNWDDPAANYQRLAGIEAKAFGYNRGSRRQLYFDRATEDRWHRRRDDWIWLVQDDRGNDSGYVAILPIVEEAYKRALEGPFDIEMDLARDHILRKDDEADRRQTGEPIYYWIVKYVFPDLSHNKFMMHYLRQRFFTANAAGFLAVIPHWYPKPIEKIVAEAGFNYKRTFSNGGGEKRLYWCDRGTADIQSGTGQVPIFWVIFNEYDTLVGRRALVSPDLDADERRFARQMFCDHWASKELDGKGVFPSGAQLANRDGKKEHQIRHIKNRIITKIRDTGYPIIDGTQVKSLIAYFARYPGELLDTSAGSDE